MSAREAGAELDALVAERVMGLSLSWWSLHDLPDQSGEEWQPNADGDIPRRLVGGPLSSGVPPYSTDIGAAWTVAERLTADGWRFVLSSREPFADGYHVVFERPPHWETPNVLPPYRQRSVYGVTAPFAISLAALAAAEPR